MNDNWEDLLNADVVELKKEEDIQFGDEDLEKEGKKTEKVEEKGSKNDSPPKVLKNFWEKYEKNKKKENKKKIEKKKDLNEKILEVNDPFGVPDRKAGNTKPSYDDKKKGEM